MAGEAEAAVGCISAKGIYGVAVRFEGSEGNREFWGGKGRRRGCKREKRLRRGSGEKAAEEEVADVVAGPDAGGGAGSLVESLKGTGATGGGNTYCQKQKSKFP